MNRFFVLEGVEGAGKGTVLQGLIGRLQADGIQPMVSREPGGTPLAEQIRDLLLTPRDEPVAPDTELLLMFASRAQHIAQFIQPCLSAGETVILDRFTDASYAYQGIARGLGGQKVEQLETLIQGELRPDRVIVLDLEPAVGLARIAQNQRETNRLDGETIEFYQRVRDGYKDRAQRHPDRYRIIDADQTPEQVLQAAWEAMWN